MRPCPRRLRRCRGNGCRKRRVQFWGGTSPPTPSPGLSLRFVRRGEEERIGKFLIILRPQAIAPARNSGKGVRRWPFGVRGELHHCWKMIKPPASKSSPQNWGRRGAPGAWSRKLGSASQCRGRSEAGAIYTKSLLPRIGVGVSNTRHPFPPIPVAFESADGAGAFSINLLSMPILRLRLL